MNVLLREEDRVLFGTLYMAKLRLLRATDPQELAWARGRVERLEVRAARIRREAK